MNRMADVAKLFGKELGEEFAVKSNLWRHVVLCRFAKDGLWLKAEGGSWIFNQPWLVFLLTGQVEIVED